MEDTTNPDKIITRAQHPSLACTDLKPWECREIPLPPSRFASTYSIEDAMRFCKEVIDDGWLHKVVALSGGGGPFAWLCELHDIIPHPQYHYSPEPAHYSRTDWSIKAILTPVDGEPLVGSPMFIPVLGIWKVRLYLEKGRPVYAHYFISRLPGNRSAASHTKDQPIP